MSSRESDRPARARRRVASLLVYLGTAVGAGVTTHGVQCLVRSWSVPVEPARPERIESSAVLTLLAPSHDPIAVETETPPATAAPPNLSGHWLVTNVVDRTTYSRFAGLRIGFRIDIEQHGNAITGRGEKYAVDEQPVPRRQRTPIAFEGRVHGHEAVVRFVEHGTRRVSHGAFHWRISPDGANLEGTFESSAAGTHGRSRADRD